ncbi:E3 ubiquitin-protein ligase ATL6 [Cytospora mali]|uniref:E3 ubiquitin-protein ligase ATL6 n=1 Tax=Cytospora mali TaxID=578113 RepID=A0A194VQ22_CYTMA|nr:E3 ubiquitin-protein ligase ATL6 [Valsa mali]
MDEDAMDYEMQYHGSHPHVGSLRTEGGCPALARWRRDQHFGNVWQDQRSWTQQSLFPPASSDAFLHPHPPPSFLHWPPSSTTSHGPMPISRPPDSNLEASFDHQIPEFALPPITHPPYSPLTFIPPAFRPQRNTQNPQGPGDFQHILHSQPSQSPTRGDMEGHGQSSPDRQSDTNSQSTFGVSPTTASVSPSESSRSGSSSSHVNEQHSPNLTSNHNPSHGLTGRPGGGGDGQSPPGRQSVPNLQSYARLPPPAASGSRGHSSDTAPERAARALQDHYGSLGVSLGTPSRGHFTSSTPAFGALRSRVRAGSNGGNSETAGSPYSSLDDDSDIEEGSSRWQQPGLRSVRQAQILRGQMSNKRVASQRAILTLQPVEVSSLPDSERTCVICYNEFGVASPEGVSETPLRLPKCKHVFGNHCILKWFEESDSCPYCRDKLPSENAALSREAIRRMLQIARDSGLPLPRGIQSFRRPMQSLRREPSDMVDQNGVRQRGSQAQNNTPQPRDGTATGERRSPPEDLSDNQPRQRPRHEPSYSTQLCDYHVATTQSGPATLFTV